MLKIISLNQAIVIENVILDRFSCYVRISICVKLYRFCAGVRFVVYASDRKVGCLSTYLRMVVLVCMPTLTITELS